MAEAFPLYWPEGWGRSTRRERSKFKTGFGAARNLLFAELGRMGASKIILSTSIPLRNDGLPRANMKPDGGDTGAAVYFQRKGKPMVFACDKYDRSEDNIYAIAKNDRRHAAGWSSWGASDMMARCLLRLRKALNARERMASRGGQLANAILMLRRNRSTRLQAQIREVHPDAGAVTWMTKVNVMA